MSEKEPYRDYSPYTLLEGLDVNECFEHAGNRSHIGEIKRKQAAIYGAFDVTLPVQIIPPENAGYMPCTPFPLLGR